jgi:hypothetical protein
MSANMASKAETLRSVSRNAEINPPVSGAYWFGELARIMGSANRRGRKLDKETLPKFPMSREVA